MKTTKENKIKGTTVIVKNDNIEGALSKFKSLIYNSGKIKELYDRQFYIKPSLKKHKQKQTAIYNQKQKDKEEI